MFSAWSPAYLEKCVRLKELGYLPPLDVGMCVGRGFADLGTELFVILPSDKLMSLFTGAITTYTEEDLKHLFVVPTADAIVSELVLRGIQVLDLSLLNCRDWNLSGMFTAGRPLIAGGADLSSVLIDALIGEISQEQNQIAVGE